MDNSNQNAQSSQKDKAHQKDQTHHFQTKKDNSFVPKGLNSAEEKQKAGEDTQPQWKMGLPKRGNQDGKNRFNEYYDPYLMAGYSNGMIPAMGMMVYPYDYMAWVFHLLI